MLSTRPSVSARICLAIAAGLAAAAVHYAQQVATPDHAGDFGVAWFGAKALLDGRNPYLLIGPGLEYDWPWPPRYPATAMVVAIPFSFLPQLLAAMLFTGISAAIFTYAITKDGWARLPVLLSFPFIVAAAAAQWSPLLSAAFLLPVVGSILIAKPTIGASIAIATDWPVQKWAIGGGVVILAVAFALMPDWMVEWKASIQREGWGMPPALLFRAGGFLVVLALLRWRRPEARLLFALALVPQTNSWYELVPLFLVARTLRESMLLAMTSSLGWLAQTQVLTATSIEQLVSQTGSLMVATGYLPALLIVLRRPNEGQIPWWISIWSRASHPRGSSTAAETSDGEGGSIRESADHR